jgi:hypothetical protein
VFSRKYAAKAKLMQFGAQIMFLYATLYRSVIINDLRQTGGQDRAKV